MAKYNDPKTGKTIEAVSIKEAKKAIKRKKKTKTEEKD